MRHEQDYYRTPSWVINLLLQHIDDRGTPPSRVLDPAAGDGAILRAVERMWPDCEVRGIEIDEHRASLHPKTEHGDGLGAHVIATGTTVIMNPPYNMVGEFLGHFVDRSWLSPSVYHVWALVRVNAIYPKKGREFLVDFPPRGLLLIPDRPRFKPSGSGDCEYVWAYWSSAQPYLAHLEGVQYLPRVPASVRRASEEQSWAEQARGMR